MHPSQSKMSSYDFKWEAAAAAPADVLPGAAMTGSPGSLN